MGPTILGKIKALAKTDVRPDDGLTVRDAYQLITADILPTYKQALIDDISSRWAGGQAGRFAGVRVCDVIEAIRHMECK